MSTEGRPRIGAADRAEETAVRAPVGSGTVIGALHAIVFSGRGSTVAAHRLDRPLTIGRDERSDIVLLDESASRSHACLMPLRGAVEVSDLGSRNGTFLDGRRVQRALVRCGALLRFGDTLVRVIALTEPWPASAASRVLLGGAIMEPIRNVVSLVGPTALPVVILGETGTGKEVVARLLHAASGRAGRFIAVNCAALPEALVESELFGHVRGAFTDAGQGRKGLFHAAEGGTLFLDEVGDIPLAAQAKLLRVLEDGEVRAVGSETARKLDVRVLSATNRDLAGAIANNGFRSDLYARLAAVEVRTPPLREHPEDLPSLVAFLLGRAGAAPRQIDADALEAMALYAWPQNIRELDSVVRSAALKAGETLCFSDLPERIQARLRDPRAQAATTTRGERIDQRTLEQALIRHGGNMRQTSAALGIARSHLYKLLARWDLDVRRFRTPGTQLAQRPDRERT